MIGDFVLGGEQMNIFGWYFTPGWLALLLLTYELVKAMNERLNVEPTS